MSELCPCVNPRLVKDGTCGICRRRCLGDTTRQMEDDLIETLWLIGSGRRRPSTQGRPGK